MIDKHINTVIILAVLSVIASITTLFIPFGEAGIDISNRAQLSTAISMTFALVLAIIAIIITAKVKSSDFQAEQSVKADTARLQSSLRSIMVKVALLSQKAPNSKAQIDFDQEFKVINDFLCSTTAFAYWSWEGHKSEKAAEGEPEGWRIFFLDLVTILDSKNNFGEMVSSAIRIEELLTSLSKKDIKTISGYTSNLARAVGDFKDSREYDPLIKAMFKTYKSEEP